MSTIHERLAELRGRPKIELYCASDGGLGLIILMPSGVFYTHQTGGYCCYHVQEEGVFSPLHRESEVDQEELLISYFCGPKWNGWCGDGIDEETAAYVDHVLSLSYQTKYLKVDRTRFGDSREAWVYVDVQEPTDNPDGAPISGFGKCKGVLTWPNSD